MNCWECPVGGKLRIFKSALTTKRQRQKRESLFLMEEKAAAAFQRAEGGRVAEFRPFQSFCT